MCDFCSPSHTFYGLIFNLCTIFFFRNYVFCAYFSNDWILMPDIFMIISLCFFFWSLYFHDFDGYFSILILSLNLNRKMMKMRMMSLIEKLGASVYICIYYPFLVSNQCLYDSPYRLYLSHFPRTFSYFNLSPFFPFLFIAIFLSIFIFIFISISTFIVIVISIFIFTSIFLFTSIAISIFISISLYLYLDPSIYLAIFIGNRLYFYLDLGYNSCCGFDCNLSFFRGTCLTL